MRTFHTSSWTLLATAALAACADQTSPTNTDGPSIAVEETVTLRFAATDTAQYLLFEGIGDSVYTAAVVPITGGVYLGAFDAASFAPISTTALISTLTPAELRTSPDIVVPTTGAYLLRVQRAGVGAPAEVEVTLRTVDARPEQVGGAVAIGEAIFGEELSDHSDLDRFTFTGVAGSWIEPELKVGGANDITRTACLTLIAPDGSWLQSTVAFPGDSAAFDPQGGRIQLPSSGTYRVEVASARNRCVGFTNYPFTGAYAFTLHEIDPLPESVAQVIHIGDTVTNEAIDRVGDFDRFRLVGAPGALTMVYAQRTGSGPRGLLRLRAAWIDHYLGEEADSTLLGSPHEVVALNGLGELTVEVSGWRDGPGGDSGSYRLFFDPIDPAPELHAAAISIGDTVSDESIEKLGDIDRYTFSGTVGQVVNVAFRVQSGPATGGLRLLVLAPDGTVQGDVLYQNPGQPDLFTGDFTLTSTGAYMVEVASAHTHHRDNVGSYQFEVRATAP